MRLTGQIGRDAEQRPELFRWKGSESRGRLSGWASGIAGKVPEDLLSLWSSTGGGELFETETLLSPFGDPGVGDDVDGVTQLYRERGLTPDWIVFHTGFGMSAFSTQDGRIAWFGSSSNTPTSVFASVDDWYTHALRAEYAGRYGLSASDPTHA